MFTVITPVNAEPTDNPTIQPKEQIRYNIKKFLLNAGEAVFTDWGVQPYQEKELRLITLDIRGPQFYDKEYIYLDPETYLPVKVIRDVSFLGKDEKIVENYDQAAGRLAIIKTVRGKEERVVIEKSAPIENIYGFIYRYRERGRFEVGEKFQIRLPTKDVEITLVKKVPNKYADNGEAYILESSDGSYQMWFGDTRRHIPLRIDGTAGFGKTSMIVDSDSYERLRSTP